MDRDEVMRALAAEGGVPGDTCRGGTFEAAAGVEFRECCGSDAAGYARREFVGRAAGGGLVCIGLDRESGRIACGSMGYHYIHRSDPCV
jgi:hypothetical protein